MTDYRAAPTAGAYQTTVQLLHVPLRIDDENQMYFANQTAQNNYFQSVIWKSLPSQTYQRENAYFRVDDDYDAIVTNCNYLRYRNAITGNKWFYAYITEFEYKNPNTTFVHFKIDAYQTYLFDITWKDCFIEREHVKDDTRGAHYLIEDINAPLVIKGNVDLDLPYVDRNTGSFELAPIIMLTENPVEGKPTVSLVNGVPNNVVFWTTAYAINDIPPYDAHAIADIMSAFVNHLGEKINTIAGIFTVPALALKRAPYYNVGSDETQYGVILDLDPGSPTSFLLQAVRHHVVADLGTYLPNGYVPHNQKMYTSQYYKFTISNLNGETLDIRPELLDRSGGTKLGYNLECAIAPDAAVYLTLDTDSVNGTYALADEAYTISLSQFPVPAIKGDYYLSWLAGHLSSSTTASVLGILQFLGGITLTATGVGAGLGIGLAASGAATLATTAASRLDAQRQPDPLLSQSNSTSKFGCGRQVFKCYVSQPTRSDAEKIDNYFTMFGYKVNELKVPEFGTRQYYNYYKMPVCNITGNIPQTALDEIRAKFQRGITLWNTSDVGNYRNGNNPIVTS